MKTKKEEVMVPISVVHDYAEYLIECCKKNQPFISIEAFMNRHERKKL